jgi:MFS family permease
MSPKNDAIKFDLLGMTLFGLFLAPFLLLLSLYKQLGSNYGLIVILIIISTVGFIGFIKTELTINVPMIKIELFQKNRTFSTANLTALLNYCALSGVSFLLSIYLQSFLKYSPAIAGLMLIPTPIAMAIISPISGKYSDKIGTQKLVSWGMGIISSSILFLVLVIWVLPFEFIILGQITLGIGSGLFSSPNQSAIMGSVEKKDSGIASGTLSTMRVTGQSISLALLSSVVGLFIPASILNPILNNETTTVSSEALLQFNQGLTVALIIASILCLLGMFITIIWGKGEQN